MAILKISLQKNPIPRTIICFNCPRRNCHANGERKKLFNIGKESNKNSHKKSSHATLITVISQVNL